MIPASIVTRGKALYKLARCSGASLHESHRAAEALTRLCHRFHMTVTAFERRYIHKVLRVPTTRFEEGLAAGVAALIFDLPETALPLYQGQPIIWRGAEDDIRQAEQLRRLLLDAPLPKRIVNRDGVEINAAESPDYRIAFLGDLYADLIQARQDRLRRPNPPARTHAPPPPSEPPMTPPEAGEPPPSEAPPPEPPPPPEERVRYSMDGIARGQSTHAERMRVLLHLMARATATTDLPRLTATPRISISSYYFRWA